MASHVYITWHLMFILHGISCNIYIYSEVSALVRGVGFQRLNLRGD